MQHRRVRLFQHAELVRPIAVELAEERAEAARENEIIVHLAP